MHLADLDLDGDLDLLSASPAELKVAWYENSDGKGSFGVQRVITTDAFRTSAVYTADLDGDGDSDVLSANFREVAWYENIDGKGTFGSQRVVSSAVNSTLGVSAADIDGDGDVDVVSASYGDGKIAWYENSDGQGAFGVQRVLTGATSGASAVQATDLDGDGDYDVLFGAYGSGTVGWFENTNGQGAFSAARILSTDVRQVSSVHSADIDGDGDADVVSGSIGNKQVAWFENTDGSGTFGAEQVIATEANGAETVFAADVDGDGDTDVLTGAYGGAYGVDNVAWFENIDGTGNFSDRQAIGTTGGTAKTVKAADVDGDGDLDVFVASIGFTQIVWYENLTPRARTVGDVNNDGLFDSGDLVLVFQAGEYEDDVIDNSTFDDGDWNGDGEFDSSDLVLAFQLGTYVSTARANASVHDRLFARVSF